jgi:hypothetical protein
VTPNFNTVSSGSLASLGSLGQMCLVGRSIEPALWILKFCKPLEMSIRKSYINMAYVCGELVISEHDRGCGVGIV